MCVAQDRSLTSWPLLQRNVWPNIWDRHYAGRHGSVPDFLLHHPQHFGRLPDSEAFFRVGRGIRFGTGFGEQAGDVPVPGMASRLSSSMRASADCRPETMRWQGRG